jgi:hypothetical protein
VAEELHERVDADIGAGELGGVGMTKSVDESPVIRPGVSGEFFRWEGWARGSKVIEAVSRGVEGAGCADGGRSAWRFDLGVGGDGPGR